MIMAVGPKNPNGLLPACGSACFDDGSWTCGSNGWVPALAGPLGRRDSGWRPVLVWLDPAGEQHDPQLGLHLLAVERHGRPPRCRHRHRGDGAELRLVLADLAGDRAPDAGRHLRRRHGELRGGDAQRRQLAGIRRLLHQRLPADRRGPGPHSGRHVQPWSRLAALVLCERRQHQRRARRSCGRTPTATSASSTKPGRRPLSTTAGASATGRSPRGSWTTSTPSPSWTASLRWPA